MLKNTRSERLFLDTNILTVACLYPQTVEERLVFHTDLNKMTNEYAIKEFRRIMLDHGFSNYDIENCLFQIKQKVTVVPTPNSQKFKQVKISDKSDKPLVYSAMDSDCVFITNDRKTYIEAKSYVETKTPEEALSDLT